MPFQPSVYSRTNAPAEHKQEIAAGMKAGQAKVDEAVATAGANINGWRVAALLGDATFFNGDWLRRATGAQAGIYGNSVVGRPIR